MTMFKFKLDDAFLEEVGLGSMPTSERPRFLMTVYADLEERVGEKLSEGLSDETLEEFGAFADKDEAAMRDWLSRNFPLEIPENREELERFYDKAASSGHSLSSEYIMSEFGAMMWLKVNRPDYPEVVKETVEEIKEKIKEASAAILKEAAANAVGHRKLLDQSDMGGLDHMVQADLVFTKLCDYLDDEELHYDRDCLKRTVDLDMLGESGVLSAYFRVVPRYSCMLVSTSAKLVVSADKVGDILECVNELNQRTTFGCFLYDPLCKELECRFSAYYYDSLPGKELLNKMLFGTLFKMDDTYPYFDAVNKGEISKAEMFERLEKEQEQRQSD